MREKILNFLKHDRSFNGALKIYMDHGPSLAVKTAMNRQGETEYNHSLLLEELRKLGNIAMDEFKSIVSLPVISAVKSVIEEVIHHPVQPVTTKEKNAFLKELPEEIKTTLRLRDEFPFLNDPDCPNALKILVADRITAYHTYVEAHKRLFTALDDKDLLKTTKGVVDNYLENQEIFKELKHYKETGQLLGAHKVFTQLDRIKEIQEMSTADQVKLQKNLMNSIARNKQKVKENPDHPETGNRTERIKEYEVELAEVNRLLGINV